MAKLALYVHWPFCLSKCPYCDFNSHVSDSVEPEEWAKAYLTELDYYQKLLPYSPTIDTLYFGGGTPSLMPLQVLESILNHLHKKWQVADDIEVTLEANPTSSSATLFRNLSTLGINRLSIGVQSLNDNDLKFLGREHSSCNAKQTLESAQRFFPNFSFDLIYARPDQTLEDWKQELKQALPYVTTHLSLYQLTIEKGTPFYQLHQQKKFTLPDENLAANMYELTDEILAEKQLYSYEISNYAKKGFESRHNQHYWRYSDYLGIGPGAHSRLTLGSHQKTAFMALHEPKNWIKRVFDGKTGVQQQHVLSAQDMLEEYCLMNLRTREGILLSHFEQTFQKSPYSTFPEQKIQTLMAEGFIEEISGYLRVKKEKRLLMNQIIQFFIV